MDVGDRVPRRAGFWPGIKKGPSPGNPGDGPFLYVVLGELQIGNYRLPNGHGFWGAPSQASPPGSPRWSPGLETNAGPDNSLSPCSAAGGGGRGGHKRRGRSVAPLLSNPYPPGRARWGCLRANLSPRSVAVSQLQIADSDVAACGEVAGLHGAGTCFLPPSSPSDPASRRMPGPWFRPPA